MSIETKIMELGEMLVNTEAKVGDEDIVAPKEVSALILKKYPDFKLSNVETELTAGSPNHSSYHHHSGNHKYYWWVSPGIYRLYNPESGKIEMQ